MTSANSSSFFQDGGSVPTSLVPPPAYSPTSTANSSSNYQDINPTPEEAATLLASVQASADSAQSSANSAATSAATASVQAASAQVSANGAAASEASANTSATDASNSATASAGSASTAAAEATASANSATAAANSAITASTQATDSANSATSAAASATAAAGSASTAATDATNAANSAAAASGSATTASTAAAALTAGLASFRALYLGEISADPTVDGNGNPLVVGAEYFNTTENKIRVYTSSGWQDYDASAQTDASNAALSATSAASSASAASTSATNAASSASAASGSANTASTQATNAGNSATAAASSASAAATSATNAANSATAAAASAASIPSVIPNSKLATMADGTIKSNISGSTAAPSDNTISAVLDKLFGTTQGAIIYRDSATWQALAPGTAGQVLSTNGAGANPTWIAGGGGTAPTGMIGHFAASSVPTGWLECNGAAVSRTTYAALFAFIGTTWGAGDGSTTFNLPDFRGVFLRGWDHSKGVDSGRTFASYQADMFASHNHTLTDPGHNHTATDSGHQHSYNAGTQGYNVNGGSQASSSLAPGGQATGVGYANITVASHATGITIAAAGSTETAPKNYAVLMCIKT